MARRFLDRLSVGDRAALTAALRVEAHADGDAILSQGDGGADAFVLLDGRAAVVMHAEDGRMLMSLELAAGDLFGEFAAIDGRARSADVVARGPVRVGRLSQNALLGVMVRAPGVGLEIMRHLVEIIRALGARVSDQTTLHVRERLLRELARQGRAAAGDGDAATLAPAPTHAALAANIGTHREAVTKQLSALARAGLVVRARGSLRLPSLRALEREAARGID